MAEQANAVMQEAISQWLGDDWRTLGDLAGQADIEPKLNRLQPYFGDRDIRAISRDELVEVLRQTIWTQLHGDELPAENAKELFLKALEVGPHEAISWVQTLLGIEPVDGIMGPQTVKRLNQIDAHIEFFDNLSGATQKASSEQATPQPDNAQHAEPIFKQDIFTNPLGQEAEFIQQTQPSHTSADTEFSQILEGFDVDAIAKKSSSDIWTTDDQLGYAGYAQAIAKMILEGKAEPPLTISIQAPWGQGKTSLMRMIKDKLEHGIAGIGAKQKEEKQKNLPARPSLLKNIKRKLTRNKNNVPGVQTKLNNLKDWIKEEPTSTGTMLPDKPGTIPCVWFNPLYFQNSNQIWSGLAHAILHQLTDELPNQLQKERFWFRLRMKRIDTHAIRRDIFKLFLQRFLPWLLVWAGLLLFILLSSFTHTVIGQYLQQHVWAQIAPIFGGTGHLIYQWLNKNKNWSLDDKLAKYIQEPDYESDLGLLHLVDHDLDRALELLIGRNGRLCVFIDDLDRCTPATVNDILLAINQFISVQHRRLYFILGMDTHMVAMALETASQKQADAYKKTQHSSKSYGWRFMEKFVQLPFFIPRIQPLQAKKFMDSLLRESRLETVAKAAIDDIKTKISASANPEELQQVVTNFKSAYKLDVIPEVDASVAARLIDMTSDRTSETYKKLIDLAFADLELNPREIKRFLNIARLLFIRLDRESGLGSDEHLRKVVRASQLVLNWPQCLRWLQGNARSYTVRGDKTDPVQSLETLFNNPGINSFEKWRDSIKSDWGESVADIVAQADFYTFAQRIHTDPPNLQDIFAAGIF